MEKFFNPTSIAVIGASRDEKKLGYQVLNNIISSGFKGKVFPVNPEAKQILNLEAYKKVVDIQDEVDLAIIIVPSKVVPDVLADCAKKNVSYAIIISSGFSEGGEKGKILQEKLKENIIKTSPIRVLGPNCLGILNTSNNLNATFAAPKLIKGNLAAVFQSGALGVALLDWAKRYQFGFSKLVSLGNKIDIEESELLEYLGEDPDTKIIALYLEQISNPKKFFEVARSVAKLKPIVLLKGGNTKVGAKAAFSHTAAMISAKEINKAIFSQSNLIVADSIEEMLNIIQILSTEPPANSTKLAILTNAGGPGILVTDVAAESGMKILEPNDSLQKKLINKLDHFASLNNPFDLAGDASAKSYEQALELLAADSQYSSIIVLLTPQTSTEIENTAEVIAKFNNVNKPIIASFLGDNLVSSGIEILRKKLVPHFAEPESAIKALALVERYWNKLKLNDSLIEFSNSDPGIHTGGDALELLSHYNIPVPPSGMATNIDVAMKIVGRIGMPVAVKNISNKFVHKYKAGKVILNIQTETYLKDAIKKVGFPVLIQKMVESPFEIIIGAKRDPVLGVLITFGWGGIFTEDIGDFSLRILPLTENDLDEMIKETRIGRILIKENIDLSSLKNIVLNVCQIMTDCNDIDELDINPVKVFDNKALCVDARFK